MSEEQVIGKYCPWPKQTLLGAYVVLEPNSVFGHLVPEDVPMSWVDAFYKTFPGAERIRKAEEKNKLNVYRTMDAHDIHARTHGLQRREESKLDEIFSYIMGPHTMKYGPHIRDQPFQLKSKVRVMGPPKFSEGKRGHYTVGPRWEATVTIVTLWVASETLGKCVRLGILFDRDFEPCLSHEAEYEFPEVFVCPSKN